MYLIIKKVHGFTYYANFPKHPEHHNYWNWQGLHSNATQFATKYQAEQILPRVKGQENEECSIIPVPIK